VLVASAVAILESLGIERNHKWQFRQADGTILGPAPAAAPA
jgi:hypothetical protein